ncbi:hypothetical protein [Polaribacter sp. M15]
MKNIIFVIILLTSLNCYNQKVELFFDVNGGILTNLPLRKFHNELADDIQFNGIKTTDNFNYNYGFSVGFKVNSINTSFFFSQKVAGSKSSLADYSGFVSLTNEIKGNTFGAYYEKEIKKIGKGQLLLGIKGVITFSDLTLSNKNSIITNTEEVFIFKSIDFGSGLLLSYKTYFNKIFIKPFLGFDAYFGGKLKFEEIPDAHLTFENGSDVKTGWTGINGGIGIGFILF